MNGTGRPLVTVATIICCLLHSYLLAAADDGQCAVVAKHCTCEGDLDIENDGDYDARAVGLAGATGAMSGLLAAGSAAAAYFYFRGKGGCGGGPGGGTPEAGGLGSRYSRPESSSSYGSYGSESPLTQRGDNTPATHRAFKSQRPYTGASTTSNATNIYRQGKVWPGRF